MRYAIGLGVGLLVMFGIGLAIGYALPGGTSILGSRVSLTQTKYLAQGQLAGADCYYDESDQYVCASWDEVEAFPQDQAYPGQAPLDEEPFYYVGTYYDQQQRELVDVFDQDESVLDSSGNPAYQDAPYYGESPYDPLGNYVDEGPYAPSPYDVPLTNQWGELVDPYGAPIDYWGDPIVDDGPVDIWGDPIYDKVLYYDGPFDLWGDPIEYELEDEWEDYERYNSDRYSVRAPDPWYVQAFPGLGKMVQRMIPGQQVQQQPTIRPVQPAPRPAQPVYPQASCWISAQPTVVAQGGSSLLNWASFNATQAALTGFGQVSLSGSRTVNGITGTQTFTLQVAGQGGKGSCYTRVSAQQPSGPLSCVISVNPTTISAGESASLAWFSQNASSAVLSGVGPVPLQSGISVRPSQSTTYLLTVSSADGRSTSCNARLTVQ